MNPDDRPPSSSSVEIRSFQQEKLQLGATADELTLGGQNNQRSTVKSMTNDSYNQDGTTNRGLVDGAQGISFSSDHNHGQGNSFNHGGAFKSGLSNSSGYGDSVQPPSVGAVRPLAFSQPYGGDDLYTGGQPPSRNDVARREPSQTGPSFTGNQLSDSLGEAGMSLTGNNFRKYYQNAFHKGNDEN